MENKTKMENKAAAGNKTVAENSANAENKTNPFVLFFQESWLLIVSALCFGLLLAGFNIALKPKIEENRALSERRALVELMPEAEDFVPLITKELFEGIPKPLTFYRAEKEGQVIGWIFNGSGAGYADTIELLIGVDSSFEKIIGYNILFSNETVGFGDKIEHSFFKDQFVGAPVGKLELLRSGDNTAIDEEIIAITGATISSETVVNIFNKHLLAVKQIVSEKGLLE